MMARTVGDKQDRWVDPGWKVDGWMDGEWMHGCMYTCMSCSMHSNESEPKVNRLKMLWK